MNGFADAIEHIMKDMRARDTRASSSHPPQTVPMVRRTSLASFQSGDSRFSEKFEVVRKRALAAVRYLAPSVAEYYFVRYQDIQMTLNLLCSLRRKEWARNVSQVEEIIEVFRENPKEAENKGLTNLDKTLAEVFMEKKRDSINELKDIMPGLRILANDRVLERVLLEEKKYQLHKYAHADYVDYDTFFDAVAHAGSVLHDATDEVSVMFPSLFDILLVDRECAPADLDPGIVSLLPNDNISPPLGGPSAEAVSYTRAQEVSEDQSPMHTPPQRSGRTQGPLPLKFPARQAAANAQQHLQSTQQHRTTHLSQQFYRLAGLNASHGLQQVRRAPAGGSHRSADTSRDQEGFTHRPTSTRTPILSAAVPASRLTRPRSPDDPRTAAVDGSGSPPLKKAKQNATR